MACLLFWLGIAFALVAECQYDAINNMRAGWDYLKVITSTLTVSGGEQHIFWTMLNDFQVGRKPISSLSQQIRKSSVLRRLENASEPVRIVETDASQGPER